MQYYFAPLACSLAGHVLIREAGLPVERIAVSLRRGECQDGQHLEALSRKSLVPLLRLPDGRMLSENIAVLCALADIAPRTGLLPGRDTPEGLATLEWLSFTATEIHKLGLYPIFQRNAPHAVRDWSREQLGKRMAIAAAQLERQPWLAGRQFTIADAYFGWALMLAPHAGIDLSAYPSLQDAWERLMQRPAFANSLAEEQRLYPDWA